MSAQVILRARQLLVASRQASYDIRHNQLENIFQSAVGKFGHSNSSNSLHELIESETTIFDVLPDFFYHADHTVGLVAFEVYIRRAYIAYDIISLQHMNTERVKNADGSSHRCHVEFRFSLPVTHPHHHLSSEGLSTLDSDLRRIASLSVITSEQTLAERIGVMVSFESLPDLELNFEKAVLLFPSSPPGSPVIGRGDTNSPLKLSASFKDIASNNYDLINILNISLKINSELNDDQTSDRLKSIVLPKKWLIVEKGLRRITFLVLSKKDYPKYFTFRCHEESQAGSDIDSRCSLSSIDSEVVVEEDTIFRHLEPAMAFQLEVTRMRAFDLKFIPTSNRKMHVYLGTAKMMVDGKELEDCRFFTRSIIRHSDLITKEASFEFLRDEGEKVLLEALDELELAMSNQGNATIDCNHIFLNFVPTVIIEPSKLCANARSMVMRYGTRLLRLRVVEAELKMMIKTKTGEPAISTRLFVNNKSGYFLELTLYKEVVNPSINRVVYETMYVDGETGSSIGKLDGLPVTSPYLTKGFLQSKRCQAQKMGTTYVYDYPEMFNQALLKVWSEFTLANPTVKAPDTIFSSVEMYLDSMKKLCCTNRQLGDNSCGMVAWIMTLHTPEYPAGRQIVVIANDITFCLGSFGTDEDELYLKASQHAKLLGIPRLYVASNSGARIGLAEEIKSLFRVAWRDNQNIEKGFKYLYLTPHDYKKVASHNSVLADLIEDEGESRYRLRTIVGKDHGIGVENLQGSGKIAGETSDAYTKIVSYSMVSCRTIGIGAYIVRLGQRVIQVDNSFIILTGAPALNKLLGRPVYTSNTQLGGSQIMWANGISHAKTADDFNGVFKLLEWLSYVPKHKGGPLPILEPLDPIDRDVEFRPPKGPYNVRHMLTGCVDPNDPARFLSGFFDRDSWDEILSGWALSTVAGRARLGGIPLGVIAVETRPVDLLIPADPANLESELHKVQQPGMVWFPDSAYKTSQAISDFNQEELPLLIFANWRGFSGGMKDMYEQVIKFGAYIVDALRTYRQPVIIYIPPNGELRGGAWVVVDPSINPQYIEMYADKDARGGILEPEGVVEIKFRQKDQLKVMRRLDDTCKSIYDKLHGKPTAEPLSEQQKEELKKQLKAREDQLMPLYHTIAIKFAELHDTPKRMLEKGVITDIIDWKHSRHFFYWRFRRLIYQETASKKIMAANSDLSNKQILGMLQRWFVDKVRPEKMHLWKDDREVCEWLKAELEDEKSSFHQNLRHVGKDYLGKKLNQFVLDHPDIAMESLTSFVQTMTLQQRNELISQLSAVSGECPDRKEDDSA